MRPWLPFVMLGVFAAALALFAARIAWHSYRAAVRDFQRTAPGPFSARAADAGVAQLQSVTFAGAGETLAAWYVPSRNSAAVILVHGTGAERGSLLAETRILAAAGFGVLTLDLPGQGLSGGDTRWGDPEVAALSAAIDWLQTRPGLDRERIGGFGLSFGGYVLLQCALRDMRLRAVVLASTPEDLDEETRRANAGAGFLSVWPALWVLHRYRGAVKDVPPVQAVRALAPRAVFVIGGERDRLVPPRAAQALFAAALRPKEIWIVPGAGHAGFAMSAPREYAARLAGFFEGLLGAARKSP